MNNSIIKTLENYLRNYKDNNLKEDLLNILNSIESDNAIDLAISLELLKGVNKRFKIDENGKKLNKILS